MGKQPRFYWIWSTMVTNDATTLTPPTPWAKLMSNVNNIKSMILEDQKNITKQCSTGCFYSHHTSTQHLCFFEKNKMLTAQTSNTLLTDGVYYGRLANANAIAGRFEKCNGIQQVARCRAYCSMFRTVVEDCNWSLSTPVQLWENIQPKRNVVLC